ncbi:MAG: SPASM domain-containing protein, partial [Endomicrobiales bacterium]
LPGVPGPRHDPGKSGPAPASREGPEKKSACPRCLWPWQQLIIDRQGEVRVHCYCDTVVGNISTARLAEIWNNGRMATIRKKMLSGDPALCAARCVSGAIPPEELSLKE